MQCHGGADTLQKGRELGLELVLGGLIDVEAAEEDPQLVFASSMRRNS